MARRLIASLGFVAALVAADVSAQDARTLRIAGLSLGAPVGNLATHLSKHGFFAAPGPTDPRVQQREATRTHRIAAFSRTDGHTLRIGVQRDQTPIVRSLDYGMGEDVDTYELIRKHLRGLFGQPTVVHGSDTSVRIAIWEIAGTDMNIDGLLTTVITLVRDPIAGHTLTVRDQRIRPEFARPSRRSRSNTGSTE